MPKRNPPPEAVAPIVSLVAPPPPSPIIVALRKDWRWAAISQFIWTFSDAFGLVDWDIEELEADMDGDETAVLPTVLAKLLFALTYNRQINRDNAYDNLRKTYLKRIPETTPFGTLEEPIEWATLGLSQKVKVLHELCEWQLDNPARFRALLKTEDEEATWRVDPLGWDKLGNTYYLFDDNRLWVQRVPPAPPRAPKKTSLKAKRAERAQRKQKPQPKKPNRKPQPAKVPTPPPKVEEPVTGSRKRTQVSFFGNLTPTAAALKRGGSSQNTPTSTRGMRSSSRLHGPSSSSMTESPSKQTPTRPAPLPRGTRVSRRLRDVDDEWQQVPEEWLSPEKAGAPEDETNGESSKRANGKSKAKVKDEDEESDLSELTDEEEHERAVEAIRLADKQKTDRGASEGALTPLPDDANGKDLEVDGAEDTKMTPVPDGEDELVKDEAADVKAEEEEEAEEEAEDAEGEEQDEVKLAAKQSNALPEGFVEWEAVCVTLYDWRTFPAQFANSKDADEKALYQLLAEQVGPTIIDQLVAKEQERIKQQAVMNRKRSSRIATKELQREEILRRQNAQAEMEQRMTSQRLQEKRLAQEEAEAAAREKAREDRFKEREERAQAREEARVWEEREKERELEQQKEERERRKRKRLEGKSGSATGTPQGGGGGGQERWELACEICKLSGWNIDEEKDLVLCEDCGRWQHVECHDQHDRSQGRQTRNWDKVDFKCQECLRRAAKKRQRLSMEAAAANAPPRHMANGLPGHPAPPPGHSQHAPYYSGYPQNGQGPQAVPPNYPYAPVQAAPHMAQSHSGHAGRMGHPPQHAPHPSQHPHHPQQHPPQLQYPPHHTQQVHPQQMHHPQQHPSQHLPQHQPQQRSVPHSGQHPFAPDPRQRTALPSLGQATGYTNGHGHAQPHPGYSQSPGSHQPHAQAYPGPPRQSPQHGLSHPTPPHHAGPHASQQTPLPQGPPRQSPQHAQHALPTHAPPPHGPYPPHHTAPPHPSYPGYPPPHPSHPPHPSQTPRSAPPNQHQQQQWSQHQPHPGQVLVSPPQGYSGGQLPPMQACPRPGSASGPSGAHAGPGPQGGYPGHEQAQRRPSQGAETHRA